MHDIYAALDWAASQLDLPALADSGYDGAGQGIRTPYKQPTGGARPASDNRTHSTLLRTLRREGEQSFAILTGRWRVRHTTASHEKPAITSVDGEGPLFNPKWRAGTRYCTGGRSSRVAEVHRCRIRPRPGPS
jgi:hypothetical protein